MPDQPLPEVELLCAAYAAFNARDFDAAFATMAPDVAWPRAFKGGVVRGHQEVRAYWTEQWAEIDPHVEPVAFHPEGAGQILVEDHRVVRDLHGAVLGDEHVSHRFTIADGVIQPRKPPAAGVERRRLARPGPGRRRKPDVFAAQPHRLGPKLALGTALPRSSASFT
jgi:hypothetical protein